MLLYYAHLIRGLVGLFFFCTRRAAANLFALLICFVCCLAAGPLARSFVSLVSWFARYRRLAGTLSIASGISLSAV